MDGDIKPAAVQIEAQLLSNGIAQAGLGIRIERSLQHGRVRGSSLLPNRRQQRPQPIAHLREDVISMKSSFKPLTFITNPVVYSAFQSEIQQGGDVTPDCHAGTNI